jgi:pimeloyl-ACP methyl ester carboxylesterase
MKNLIPVAFEVGSKLAPNLSAKVALQLFSAPQRLPRPKAEKEIWGQGEPIQFRSGRVARLYGKSGPLLFFVHGWEGRGSQWFRYVEPALQKGFRVLLWDGPAHGDSPGKKANVVIFAKAMIEDMVELDETPYAVIGHSMGGASVGILPEFSVQIPRTVTIAAPTQVQGVLDRYFDLIRLQDQARKRAVQLISKETGFTVDKASLTHTHIQAKLFVIHDENDKEVPYSDFLEMKKLNPQFSYFTTHGLGHRRILYSDEVMDQVFRFLNTETDQAKQTLSEIHFT